MLVTFSINLFNDDRITTFSEREYDLSTYPKKKFDQDLAINYFKKIIMKYEINWNSEKFSYEINSEKNNASMSYFTNNNKMEYHMVICY